MTQRKISDSELARRLGVTRAAIYARRRAGWTEEEILANRREKAGRATYSTEISRSLGMTVADAAEREGVSRAEIYRRWRRHTAGKDVGVPILRKTAATEAKESALCNG